MVIQTLLVSAAFSLIASVIYAYVGYRLTRRSLPEGTRLAAYAFVAFWYGIAVSTLTGPTGLQALLAAFGQVSLPAVLLMTQVGLVAISVGLWGLLYYLVYLYTGWHGVWKGLAAFYIAFYAFLQYFIVDAGPVGLHTDRWSVVVDYRKDLSGPDAWMQPYVLALIIGLLVPQIVAALAYLTLAFRVHDPTQRYRVLLVSISILVWFATPFFALGADVAKQDTYQVVSRLIGLAAAITIYMAYQPPRWIRRRYGILALSDESKPDQSAVMQDPFERALHARRPQIDSA
jgi:hypothetical protein